MNSPEINHKKETGAGQTNQEDIPPNKKDEAIGILAREEASRYEKRLRRGGSNGLDKTGQDGFKTGMSRAFGNAIHEIKGETGNPKDEGDVIKDLKNLGKIVASPKEAPVAIPAHILKRTVANATKEIVDLKQRLGNARGRGDAETTEWAKERITLETAKREAALKELGGNKKYFIKNNHISVRGERAMKNPEAARLSEEQPSLKQDPRYKQLVEEASLRYLKERDATWFYKNYSGGRSANGYLLDRNGRETNFLPSQNISGGIVNIRARAKTEFMRLYPEDAKKYGEKSTAPIMQKPGGQKRVIEDELKKLLGKESTKDGGLKWIEIEEVGEAKSKLTGEAVELLKNIGDSIPAFISKNLRRILKENKIEIGPNDTPQDAINKLK